MQKELKELRLFVAKKRLEPRSRQTVAGEDLRKMGAAAKTIPDADLRAQVEGLLRTRPKYEALGMLLNENHQLMKKHPEVALLIARSGTDVDRVAAHYPPAV